MSARWLALALLSLTACDGPRAFCVGEILRIHSEHEGWENVLCPGACAEANGGAECVAAPLRECTGSFCDGTVLNSCGNTGYVVSTDDCRLIVPWPGMPLACVTDGTSFCAYDEPKCPDGTSFGFCSSDGTRLYSNCNFGSFGYPTSVFVCEEGEDCGTPPPVDGVEFEPQCIARRGFHGLRAP